MTAARKVASAASVTITAALKSDASVSAQWTLEVCPKVTSVQLSAPQTSLDLGTENTLQLTAVVSPADAIQTVTWSASSSKGVTVSADGLATFSRVGTYKITVKSGGKSAYIRVTVSYAVHSLEITGGA